MSRGVVISARLRQTSSAICSANRSAPRRSSSVTTRNFQPKFRNTSQGWMEEGDVQCRTLGSCWWRFDGLLTWVPTSVRIPRQEISNGRFANAHAGEIRAERWRQPRRAIRSPRTHVTCGSGLVCHHTRQLHLPGGSGWHQVQTLPPTVFVPPGDKRSRSAPSRRRSDSPKPSPRARTGPARQAHRPA